MVSLLSNLLNIPADRCRDWFHKADGNRDGVVQVHEFISWLTENPPMNRVFESEKDGKKTVDVTIINPSGAVAQVFTCVMKNHENVAFPKGNPISIRVKPGETITETLLHVESEPFKYHYSVSCLAEGLFVSLFFCFCFSHSLYLHSQKTNRKNNTFCFCFPSPPFAPIFAGFRADWSGVEDDPKAFVDGNFPHEASSIVDPQRADIDLGKTEKWIRARLLGVLGFYENGLLGWFSVFLGGRFVSWVGSFFGGFHWV